MDKLETKDKIPNVFLKQLLSFSVGISRYGNIGYINIKLFEYDIVELLFFNVD